MKKLLSIIVVSLLLVGCSQNKPTVANTPVPVKTAEFVHNEEARAVVVPEGWSRAEAKDGELSLALPPGWVITNSEDPEMQKMVKDLVKKNAAFANNVNTNYYFMAFDSELKDNFSDNLNVIKKEVGQTLPFNEETAQALKTELAKNVPGAKEVNIKVVEIPHGKAFRYTATADLKGPKGNQIHMFAIGYLTFRNTTMYVLTFSTTPKHKDDLAKKVDMMVNSLLIGK